MNEQHVYEILNQYVDDTLSNERKQEVASHLAMCPLCNEELKRLEQFLADVQRLPKEIQPKRDLWKQIENKLERKQSSANVLEFHQTKEERKSREQQRAEIQQSIVAGSVWYFRAAAIVLVFIISAALVWYFSLPELPTWQVTRLEGSPKIESRSVSSSSTIQIGEILETDNSSRASLTIGTIGELTVAPNSRLRLLNTSPVDHRLSLEHGSISAQVSAPPRLFVVETPSAQAVDLGCAYNLTVDSTGASTLQVITGWVSLEYGGRESVVPYGAMCMTKPGVGPGAPFQVQASEQFRKALFVFDFENGETASLDTILFEASSDDGLTLWHVLFRVEEKERARVYDRLAELVPPPKRTTREGVLRGDKTMLHAWKTLLNLNPNITVQLGEQTVQ
jgi:ferric-dicitrate binding protein FerR (iron transport regulator)